MLYVKHKFTRFILANKDFILAAFGNGSVPITFPKVEKVKRKRVRATPIKITTRLWTRRIWGEKKEVLSLIARIILFLDSGSAREFSKRIQYFATDPYLIYYLRVAGYIFSTMFVPIFPATSHPIMKTALMILEAMKPYKKKRKLNPVCVYDTTSRKVNSLPSYNRYTFFHKFLTPTKRLLGKLQNDVVTKRWELAEEKSYTIDRRVNPGPNYSLQVATLDYITNKATRLKIDDLIYLVQFFSEKCYDTTDKDLIHVFINLNAILRARFKAKTIELNKRDCTCHAKCCGYLGNYPFLERAFHDEVVKIHMSTNICPTTRLSNEIDNTTSIKPKRCITAHNPGLSTCSADGATSLSRLALYKLDFTNKSGVMRYSQRVYTTNSVIFTDQLYRKVPTTATARVYGMCFSGKRSCHKMCSDVMSSSKQEKIGSPFTDLAAWWRCKDCRRVRIFEEDNHIMEGEEIHEGTCVKHIFHSYRSKKNTKTLEELVAGACRGCKASLMCRHAINGALRKPVLKKTFSLHLCKRLTVLLKIRKIVYQELTS